VTDFNNSAGKLVCNNPMTGAIVISLVLLSWLPAAALGDAEGDALAKKLYERPDGRDSAAHTLMILEEKGRKPRQRTLYTYRVDNDDGGTWSLIRFTEPADIDGTGLLTQDQPGDESSQWIYLPALDRTRRISSSRKGGRFVGSDIFYEDLRKRAVENDQHRILGNGKVGKIPTIILESIPVDPGNSVYSKRISWVHANSLIPLQVDFYTADGGKPSKHLKVNKLQKIQGYWTVLDSTMHDLDSGHQTRMVIQSIKYDQKLPSSLFSRQTLSDTRLEEKYRP